MDPLPSPEGIDLLVFYSEALELLNVLEVTDLHVKGESVENGTIIRGQKIGSYFLVGVQRVNEPEIFLSVMQGYSNNWGDTSVMISDDPRAPFNLLRVSAEGAQIQKLGDSKRLLDLCIIVKKYLLDSNRTKKSNAH